MKRSGFPAAMAGGIEAVASRGGQLMPPIVGAAMFLMAEFIEAPYGDVMLAALLPILLYYMTLFLQVDLAAAKHRLVAVPRDRIRRSASLVRVSARADHPAVAARRNVMRGVVKDALTLPRPDPERSKAPAGHARSGGGFPACHAPRHGTRSSTKPLAASIHPGRNPRFAPTPWRSAAAADR
jgi:hypothetical protein